MSEEHGPDLPAVTPSAAPAPAVSDGEIATARGYVEASRAASTRRAYDSDWRRFSAWCQARGAPALPASPALVAVYLSALAASGKAPPSIGRAQAAIAHIHARAGHVPPHRAEGGMVIAEALAGIRRSRKTTPDRKAAADAEFLLVLRDVGLSDHAVARILQARVQGQGSIQRGMPGIVSGRAS